MQFRKIKFTNYRCFQNGELDFSMSAGTASGKNIIICLWENGGGKTNLMFAFRFALYGMTEKEFKSIAGQESTPWALNQNLYKKLEESEKIGDRATAEVELSFEFRDTVYTIRRIHEFERGKHGVTNPTERVILFVQDGNGDTNPPCHDPKEVRRIIERIIPEKTLYALLCDGERVKRLSAAGDETNGAIQAVIARMAEHELLNLIADGVKSVRVNVHKRVTSSSVCEDDKLLVVKAANIEKSLKDDEEKCDSYEQRIITCRDELERISQDLEQIESVKQLEKERAAEEKGKNRLREDLQKDEKRLLITLNKQSYWTMAGGLCDEVRKLMDDTTLRFPGLEADVVEMVMKGSKCICGCDITEHMRKHMEALRKKLPPFNVDAILSAVIHEYGTAEHRENYRQAIGERLETLQEKNSRINDVDHAIAELRKRIEASQNPNAVALEQKRRKLQDEIAKCQMDGAVLRSNMEKMQGELFGLNKRLKELSKKTGEGRVLGEQLEYLESAERGIKAIKKIREEAALVIINRALAETFALLRSTSDSQRQAYVTRFEDKHRLVVYHEGRVRRALARLGANVTDVDIEQEILRNDTSSSAGQLKIASLAFMKAVLDYVHETAKKDENMRDAEYPIIMDAPFGDIKGENYDHAVTHLHSFANQVILLLADDDIPAGIAPYVGRRYILKKMSDKEGEFSTSKIIHAPIN